MKRPFMTACWVWTWLLVSTLAAAADSELVQADRLFRQGGLENLEASIPLYAKAVAEEPDNFDANWKCSRAHREYANLAMQEGVSGWERICAEHGKAGMEYAQKAIDLQPDKPDGYFYYGVSAGTYSDGVSIATALGEGLKNKVQTSLERAYAIDKTYEQGAPILALGRFWAVLPWPLQDRQKALAYYREYQKTGFLETSTEGQVYFSELLIKIGGDSNKAEARKYLKKAIESPISYYRNLATELMSEVGK